MVFLGLGWAEAPSKFKSIAGISADKLIALLPLAGSVPLASFCTTQVVAGALAVSVGSITNKLLPERPDHEARKEGEKGQHDVSKEFHHFFPGVPSNFFSMSSQQSM